MCRTTRILTSWLGLFDTGNEVSQANLEGAAQEGYRGTNAHSDTGTPRRVCRFSPFSRLRLAPLQLVEVGSEAYRWSDFSLFTFSSIVPIVFSTWKVCMYALVKFLHLRVLDSMHKSTEEGLMFEYNHAIATD